MEPHFPNIRAVVGFTKILAALISHFQLDICPYENKKNQFFWSSVTKFRVNILTQETIDFLSKQIQIAKAIKTFQADIHIKHYILLAKKTVCVTSKFQRSVAFRPISFFASHDVNQNCKLNIIEIKILHKTCALCDAEEIFFVSSFLRF